jgi:micrococcal nuclease
MMNHRLLLPLLALALPLLACAFGFTPPTPGTAYTEQPPGSNVNPPGTGEQAQVTNVIDGDTIEVRINTVGYRIRYIGVNTPERDEPCYGPARDFNVFLVGGKTVTLVPDQENTDQYGRLLRYVYADNVFVNEQLILQGFAEVVQYPPNTRFADYFIQLEQEAARFQRGCHPAGIFNDGSFAR